MPSASRMFVGGISVSSSDLSEYENILGGDFHMGLKGCIANLVVNGIFIDLKEDALEGTNVDSCDDSLMLS